MKKLKLYFCQITDSRWYENEENIRNIYPYVDKIIIIDGGTTDGTIEGLKKIAAENDDKVMIFREIFPRIDSVVNKIMVYRFPWRDDFIASRNCYMDVVEAMRKPGGSSWIIISDSDEYLSERLRKRLRKLCEWADQKKYTMLKVRCRGVELDAEGNRVHEQIDNYWKELIFKYEPGLRISGLKVHHGFSKQYSPREVLNLPDNLEDGKDKEILYEHRKAGQGVIWSRANCRNFFIFGGGSNLGEKQLLWKPFREMLNRLIKPKSWHDYQTYLESGKIDIGMANWLVQYMFEGIEHRPKEVKVSFTTADGKNITHGKTFEFKPSPSELSMGFGYDGSSEIREGFKYFYEYLFPERMPFGIREIIKEYSR